MNASYKIVLLGAFVLFVAIVGYYLIANESKPTDESTSQQKLADTTQAPSKPQTNDKVQQTPTPRPPVTTPVRPGLDRSTPPVTPTPQVTIDAPTQPITTIQPGQTPDVDESQIDTTPATDRPGPAIADTGTDRPGPGLTSTTDTSTADPATGSTPTTQDTRPGPSTTTTGVIEESATPGRDTGRDTPPPVRETTPTTPTTTTQPTTTPTATPRTYTVQPGDTFASIAEKVYGNESAWFEIAQANPSVDPKRLQVDQVIVLPNMSDKKREQEEVKPPAPGNDQTYTVRPGDTLSKIAKKFYNDSEAWDLIYNRNRDRIGPSPDDLKVGMELIIPQAYSGAR